MVEGAQSEVRAGGVKGQGEGVYEGGKPPAEKEGEIKEPVEREKEDNETDCDSFDLVGNILSRFMWSSPSPDSDDDKNDIEKTLNKGVVIEDIFGLMP